MPSTHVHPTAIIGNHVTLGEGVEVGPYCTIEDDVVIGDRTVLMSHVVIGRYTQLGSDNRVYPFTTLGLPPQDLKFSGEKTVLEIGNNNQIREHVTIHRGTGHGGGLTKIGNHGLVMVGSHVGHDCFIGDHVIMSHGATLAGHVIVGDHANVGAYSGVHQFCKVGDYAFIGGFSVVTQDALPYVKTVGNRAKIYGINKIGLERKGFTKEEVENLHKAYRILFHKKLRLAEAIEQLEAEYAECPRVTYMVNFIKASERGITR